MKYLIRHSDTIEANSEDEARQAYKEGWEGGHYSEDDLEVSEEEKGGT